MWRQANVVPIFKKLNYYSVIIISVITDLDWLNKWVVRWQMEFNHDKCRVINVGNLEGKILTTGST